MQDLLTDTLKAQINDAFVAKAGQAAQVDANQAQSLINTALPFLVGALAKNSANAKGAAELDQALTKDHDGSIFNHLDDALGDSAMREGGGILQHLFTDPAQVEELLAGQTGAGKQETGKILAMLAPVVMGALGKAKLEQGLDAGNIAGLLQQATGSLKQEQGMPMALAQRFLDADGDGKISDDLFSMVLRFLKRIFSK